MNRSKDEPLTPGDEAEESGTETDERWRVLHQLEEWVETPMAVLAFFWLLLVVAELVWTTSGVFELLGTIIWIIFIAEFALRFLLAPDKLSFLKRNPITIVALIAPAFRFLSILRFFKVARGLRLVRVVGTANRGLNALRISFGRRGLGYVAAATAIITLLGAAAMLNFEPATEVKGGFSNFADALWWTAMIIATMGSQYWPTTPEGRLICLLLSVYGFAVFGYLTASLATFFIGQEAQANDGTVAGTSDFAALREEIASLRKDLLSREENRSR